MFRKLFSLWHKIHTKIQLNRVNVGSNPGVFGKVYISNRKNLYIGKNFSINEGAYINAFNNIYIGDDVMISAGAKLISTGLDIDSWVNGNKKHISNTEIVIGSHCWIGANAIILPGVRILGEYVVVAAGAVVTANIDEGNCIYAGCPARKIKDIKNAHE